jgi:hypothetical protein
MPAEMPERARLLHYNRRRFFLNLFVFSSAAQKRYQSRMKVSRQGKRIRAQKVTSRSRFALAILAQKASRGLSRRLARPLSISGRCHNPCAVLCYRSKDERGIYRKHFVVSPAGEIGCLIALVPPVTTPSFARRRVGPPFIRRKLIANTPLLHATRDPIWGSYGT